MLKIYSYTNEIYIVTHQNKYYITNRGGGIFREENKSLPPDNHILAHWFHPIPLIPKPKDITKELVYLTIPSI